MKKLFAFSILLLISFGFISEVFAVANFFDNFNRANASCSGATGTLSGGWNCVGVSASDNQITSNFLKMDDGATDALVEYRAPNAGVGFNGLQITGKIDILSTTQTLCYIGPRQNTPRNSGDGTNLEFFASGKQVAVNYANGGTQTGLVTYTYAVGWYNFEWNINTDNSGTVYVWPLGTQKPGTPTSNISAFTDTTTYPNWGMSGQRCNWDDIAETVATSTVPTLKVVGGTMKMKGGTTKLRGQTLDYIGI